METKKFSTYSVIPTEIMLSKDLSGTTKVLYGIISSLTNDKGYCWASNKYLGDLIGLSERQVSTNISQLVDSRYLISDVEKNYKRKIRLVMTIGGRKKTSRGLAENSEGVGSKLLHNNIKEYNKNNIISSDKSQDDGSSKINLVFKEFYELGNKGINFGNKTERKAVSWLLKEYGFDKTINTIKYAMSVQGKKYAPSITTPYQLKSNLVKLMAYYKREQEPTKGSVPIFKL